MRRALLLCVVGLLAVPYVARAADLPTRAGTTADLAEILAPLPTFPKTKDAPAAAAEAAAPSTAGATASAPTEVASCTSAADLVPADFIEKLNQLNSPALKAARNVPLGVVPLGDDSAPAAGAVRRVMGGSSSVARRAAPPSASGPKMGLSIENGVKVYRGPPHGN